MGAGAGVALGQQQIAKKKAAEAIKKQAASPQTGEVNLASDAAIEGGAQVSDFVLSLIPLLQGASTGGTKIMADAANQIIRQKNAALQEQFKQTQSQGFQADLAAAKTTQSRRQRQTRTDISTRRRAGPQTLLTRPGEIPKATKLGG